MEQQMRGYIDPRTGEYKRTTKEADEQRVHEDLAFIAAWRFYWAGPVRDLPAEDASGDRRQIFFTPNDREEWLLSEEREAWLAALTEEQRQMLADCPPPEEVPALERDVS
jgi:hypothetical protein